MIRVVYWNLHSDQDTLFLESHKKSSLVYLLPCRLLDPRPGSSVCFGVQNSSCHLKIFFLRIVETRSLYTPTHSPRTSWTCLQLLDLSRPGLLQMQTMPLHCCTTRRCRVIRHKSTGFRPPRTPPAPPPLLRRLRRSIILVLSHCPPFDLKSFGLWTLYIYIHRYRPQYNIVVSICFSYNPNLATCKVRSTLGSSPHHEDILSTSVVRS